MFMYTQKSSSKVMYSDLNLHYHVNPNWTWHYHVNPNWLDWLILFKASRLLTHTSVCWTLFSIEWNFLFCSSNFDYRTKLNVLFKAYLDSFFSLEWNYFQNVYCLLQELKKIHLNEIKSIEKLAQLSSILYIRL